MDIVEWPKRWMYFMTKIGEVNKRSDISNDDKENLQEVGKWLGELFNKVIELYESQPTVEDSIQQLIASYDRMNEELAIANAQLDRIAAKP